MVHSAQKIGKFKENLLELTWIYTWVYIVVGPKNQLNWSNEFGKSENQRKTYSD